MTDATAMEPPPRRWAESLDAVFILLFAAIGRLSHHEGLSLYGWLLTAYPFIVGALVGWVVARTRRPDTLRGGVVVWVVTVVLGMVLRAVTHQGVAVAFVVVAACFLGLFLLGWRWVADRVEARRP